MKPVWYMELTLPVWSTNVSVESDSSVVSITVSSIKIKGLCFEQSVSAEAPFQGWDSQATIFLGKFAYIYK